MPVPKPDAVAPPVTPTRRVPTWTGERVAALRRRLGLSLAEFADELGVHRMTVWKWEMGRRGVSALASQALQELDAESTPVD